MTYERYILFFCILCFAVHANSETKSTSQVHHEPSTALKFPIEAARKSLTEELLHRTTVARRPIILRENKNAPRAKFIWEVANIEPQIRLEELTFDFEAEQKKESSREKFSVTLRYEAGNLVVIHSKPSNAQLVRGVRSVVSENDQSKWGGFIYGQEVPGVLFITPQTKEESGFPVLLCPRFGIQQKGALVIQGKDPKTSLLRASGRFSGGIHVDFPTSYTAGSGSVRYTSLRAPEPEIREGIITENDPSFTFLYRPGQNTLESSPQENRETPVGILSDVRLINPAGYEAEIRLSLVMWIHELIPNSSQTFHFKQQEQLRQEELGPGMCLHIFPSEERIVQYSNPENKSE